MASQKPPKQTAGKLAKSATKAAKSATKTAKPVTKAAKSATKVAKTATKPAKSMTKAAKSTSKIAKTVTKAAKSATKAAKSATASARSTTKAAESATKTAKRVTKATKSATKAAKSSKKDLGASSPKSKKVLASESEPTKASAPESLAKPPVRISLVKKPSEAKSEPPVPKPPKFSQAFLNKQRERLLALKDQLLDAMSGVAKDTLRARAEGSEANAFGMHQADAGSDAYDRDFALSILSSEQNCLYEIDMALKRIEDGTYGICEMSHQPISQERLEALPWTRYTVECQQQIEKNNRFRARQPVVSLFGVSEEDSDGEDEENVTFEPKD